MLLVTDILRAYPPILKFMVNKFRRVEDDFSSARSVTKLGSLS